MNFLTKQFSCCLSLLLVGAVFLMPSTLKAQQSQDSQQTQQKSEVTDSKQQKINIHYWLYVPADYKPEEETKEWPLMLFLHGRGECGDNMADVKKWGPPKMLDDRKDFPFIVVSPQCSKPGWDVVALKGLLDQVSARHRVDPSRIYVTGLSMGGFGTWKFVSKYPEYVAAAIPVCGGGDVRMAESLLNVPIWAFHGDADRVVPLAGSKSMVDSIKALDGDKVKLTVYEGVGHNSWSQTYANEEIYKWLLTHKRENLDDE